MGRNCVRNVGRSSARSRPASVAICSFEASPTASRNSNSAGSRNGLGRALPERRPSLIRRTQLVRRTQSRQSLRPLKPGARLVREWHGRTYVVAVLDRAFEFNGRRFGSLTQIACEITGAHWSGPRFFGLMKRRTAQGLGLASPRATCAGEMSVPSQLKQSRPSNEEQPAICGAQEADGERVRPRAGDRPVDFR